MHSQVEAILDQAESRYLQSEELALLNQYVDSLPHRLETYRYLRDQEITMMQQVVDQMQIELPHMSEADLERSIKHVILVMRYSGMAMLLNDESFVTSRLQGWLDQISHAHKTQSIDGAMYRILNQRLNQILTPQQLNLIRPPLQTAQTLLSASVTTSAVV